MTIISTCSRPSTVFLHLLHTVNDNIKSVTLTETYRKEDGSLGAQRRITQLFCIYNCNHIRFSKVLWGLIIHCSTSSLWMSRESILINAPEIFNLIGEMGTT